MGALSLLVAIALTMKDLPEIVIPEWKAQARVTRYETSQEHSIPFWFWAGKEAIPEDKLTALIQAVLDRLPMISNSSPTYPKLLKETAMAESGGGKFWRPYHTPGRGVWQIEEWVANDTLRWLHYAYKDIFQAVSSFYDKSKDMEYNLTHNVPFGCALAATYYWRRNPIAFIFTRQQRAEFWKAEYNSPLGKGTVEHYHDSNS